MQRIDALLTASGLVFHNLSVLSSGGDQMGAAWSVGMGGGGGGADPIANKKLALGCTLLPAHRESIIRTQSRAGVVPRRTLVLPSEKGCDTVTGMNLRTF